MARELKVGDKVHIPKTKNGKPFDEHNMCVINQAKARKIPFLYINNIIGKTCTLNWETKNGGDYYSLSELELYEQHYEIY